MPDTRRDRGQRARNACCEAGHTLPSTGPEIDLAKRPPRSPRKAVAVSRPCARTGDPCQLLALWHHPYEADSSLALGFRAEEQGSSVRTDRQPNRIDPLPSFRRTANPAPNRDDMRPADSMWLARPRQHVLQDPRAGNGHVSDACGVGNGDRSSRCGSRHSPPVGGVIQKSRNRGD